MPTNTTTPEAATTTTPATNTNTTPLSAMTGEEVASILVGLIRQNDGVLIQTKLENALRSTGYAAIANYMTTSFAQGMAALYALLQSKGVSVQGNESIVECCNLLSAACLTLGNGDKLSSTATDPKAYKLISNGCNIYERFNDEGYNTSIRDYLFQNATNLIYASFPNATSCGWYSFHGTNAQKLNIPKVTTVQQYGFNFTTLKHLTCGRITSYNTWGNPQLTNCYDLICSELLTVDWNTGIFWRPTNPLLSNSQSLCTKDEWDDQNEPQGGFDNNLQKFLWYFEYHFIPCFGTVTTSPVLSLYTTVYNAINSANSIAQPTKTLKQLLTDKGWEVASVS